MDGCADVKRRQNSKLVTTNPIYRCEELEDAASLYDVLDENKLYLDVLPDEAERYVQCSKPELPSPRPVAEAQRQNQGRRYEPLKNEKSDYAAYTRAGPTTTSRDATEPVAESQDQNQDRRYVALKDAKPDYAANASPTTTSRDATETSNLNTHAVEQPQINVLVAISCAAGQISWCSFLV